MATIHISEADAARDFAGLLAQVQTGTQIIIESGSRAIAVLQAVPRVGRSLKEGIALLPEHSVGVVDEDFARDVQEGIDLHREPLNPPAWD